MNDKAKKKARLAELEFSLLSAWKHKNGGYYEFADWLIYQTQPYAYYEHEVKELIALYGEE